MGRCRRHPPVIARGDVGAAADPSGVVGGAAGGFVGKWPFTGAEDWCGEWRGLGQAGEAPSASGASAVGGVPVEPPLDPDEERWLRNTSMAQALLVLPAEKRDAVLEAVLTEEERMSSTPPDDFCDRVEAYFASQQRE